MGEATATGTTAAAVLDTGLGVDTEDCTEGLAGDADVDEDLDKDPAVGLLCNTMVLFWALVGTTEGRSSSAARSSSTIISMEFGSKSGSLGSSASTASGSSGSSIT